MFLLWSPICVIYNLEREGEPVVVPYIGITDFTKKEEVWNMVNVFNNNFHSRFKRRLHVGVMMSYKTLNGIPTKWSNAFPPNHVVADIFVSPREVYNCLHYADYDRSVGFANDLTRAIKLGGFLLDAVQLDMVWPDPREIGEALTESLIPIEVILQVGKNAMEEVDNDPEAVVKKLESYEGVFHRVLLDKSMGKGLGMDANALLPYARLIKQHFPKIGIGVAGGLGPNTMELVRPIVEEFPEVSIDAQGRLRPSGNALDPIDWDMAKVYLEKAIKMFS